MGTMDQIIKKFDHLAAKVAGVPLKRTDIPVVSSGAGSMIVSETTNVEQGKSTSVVSSGAVIIKFESDPAGASVSVDGMPMGKTTPFQKSFPAGTHRVIMALDEYKLSVSDITFSSNGQIVKSVMIPTYGYLTVTSTPSGIPVQLDGLPIGSTPILSRRVSEGGHELILGDDCWLKATNSINIESGVTRTVNQTMNSRTAGISVTAIDAITGDDLIAKISDDNGKILGETPFSGTVPLCTRSITVDASGYSQSKPVLSLVEGSVASISAKMQKGGSGKYGMKLIPAGTFQMGSTNGESDERPVHTVTVSSFYMDSTEVTQREYSRLMGTNPSNFSGDNKPVEQVSWWDAIKYCNARSREAGLTPVYNETSGSCNFSANGYRLPTEAEWEYACRAGTTTKYYWGESTSKSTISQYANYDSTSYYFGESSSLYGTHAVATNRPNSFGLYDMSGNVWEWCNDWKGRYSSGSQTDPRGPTTGSRRVGRGGGWSYGPVLLRSAFRNRYGPTDVCNDLGFRVCAGLGIGSDESAIIKKNPSTNIENMLLEEMSEDSFMESAAALDNISNKNTGVDKPTLNTSDPLTIPDKKDKNFKSFLINVGVGCTFNRPQKIYKCIPHADSSVASTSNELEITVPNYSGIQGSCLFQFELNLNQNRWAMQADALFNIYVMNKDRMTNVLYEAGALDTSKYSFQSAEVSQSMLVSYGMKYYIGNAPRIIKPYIGFGAGLAWFYDDGASIITSSESKTDTVLTLHNKFEDAFHTNFSTGLQMGNSEFRGFIDCRLQMLFTDKPIISVPVVFGVAWGL